MKRKWICFFLTVLMAFSMGMTAWAADTKIDDVELDFSYDVEPKTGEEIGAVEADAAAGQPFTVDYAEYITENETWTVGDRPVVRVGLTADSGYRFYYTSKSHFNLSGCSATFKKAKVYDDGVQLELEVYLKRVGGVLNGVEGLEWSDNTAVWEYMEGAASYDVQLYRNERHVVTVETTEDNYYFGNHMDREGFYSFRVRAISSYNDRAGEWSDYSEEFYLEEEDVWVQGGNGTWQQDGRGRWYAYDGGGYPRSCWKFLDNAWYYFDGEGYMATGWRKVDDSYYYMGTDGRMTTGWQLVDGAWYYMDPSGARTTGWQFVGGCWYYMNSSGVMMTGWQKIDGDWYYLNASGAMTTGWQYINGVYYYMDNSGVMYADRWTPDGRYVNASGAWVQ